jgi:hypothetical protein
VTVNPSRIGTVIDALVAALQASGVFVPPAQVFDGPNFGNSQWTSAVYIGFDGNWDETEPTSGTVAADINQSFVYLSGAAVSMYEELTIYCIAQGWTGGGNEKAVRDQALVMFHAVETTLRTDPTLAVDGSVIAGSSIVGQLRYEYDVQGNVACRVPFQILVKTTLLTTT